MKNTVTVEEINSCKQELDKLKSFYNQREIFEEMLYGDSNSSLFDAYHSLKNMSDVYHSMNEVLEKLYIKVKKEDKEVQSFEDFKKNPIQKNKLDEDIDKTKSGQPKNASKQEDELDFWKKQHNQLKEQIEYQANIVTKKNQEIKALTQQLDEKGKSSKINNLKTIFEKYFESHPQDQELQELGKIINQIDLSDQNLEI